ncbi:hypothetical protein KJ969_04365 [Patescibacteria group bacterium]|nr:hypothetical protein [Patescibacteria group bacterium]
MSNILGLSWSVFTPLNLLPLMVIVITAMAWRHPLLGGFAFLLLAAAISIVAARMIDFTLLIFVIIPLPPIIISILFFTDHFKNKTNPHKNLNATEP